MALADESFDFEPTREYELAGSMSAEVERVNGHGFSDRYLRHTAVYVDGGTGLLVTNREAFEAWMGGK